MNTDGVNAAVLSTFGETATITVNAVGTEVTAVFAKSFEGVSVADMSYQQDTPVVSLLTSVFEATGAAERDTVTRASDGTVYIIASIQKDEGGMTMLGVNENA